MDIDTNAPCPGGRNKAVRQCCPHLTKELDQISRTISGHQLSAGLIYVDNLLKSNPDCACLIAAKCELLRQMGKAEEFLTLARDFTKAEPDNIRARSFLASATLMNGQLAETIATLVEAVELSKAGQMSTDLVLPMLELASVLVKSGLYYAAIPFMEILEQVEPTSKFVQELRGLCSSVENVPFVLREFVFPVSTPVGFPEQEAYSQAVTSAVQIRWNTALEQFNALLPYADQYPDIYRALGILYFWLLDAEKGCEWLLEYIDSPLVNEEDRADAWMIYSDQKDSLWGDFIPVWSISLMLNDENVAMENLLSFKQLVPNDVPHWDDNSGPRPRKVFHLLDRPFPEKDAIDSLADTPRILCTFLFFGRTTDHDARIVIPRLPDNLQEKVVGIIKDVLGSSFSTQEESGQMELCSRTITGLQFSGIVRGGNPQTEKNLRKEYLLEEFCPQWISIPMNILDERTPAQVAECSEEHFKLVAAIEMFHGFLDNSEFLVEVQSKLRSLLNIPEPAPIVLSKESGTAFLDELSSTPFWRWHRIDFSGLDVETNVVLFQLGMYRCQFDVVATAAKNLFEQATEKDQELIRFSSLDYLISSAIGMGAFEQASQYVAQGKELAAQSRLSDGLWNVYDFVLAVVDENPAAQQVLQHILAEHKGEKNVMDKLQQYMIQLGLISPQPGMRPTEGVAPEPSASVAPGPAAPAQPQGLWTPENDGKPNGNGGESKLWVPGS